MDYIKIAKDSLDVQLDALQSLKESLGAEFEEALRIIANTEGRVLLCGIGKSGIVAKKIASTFSSIGCSSFFVHGNEASHGDLGAIDKKDVVIVLSNSGETKELVDVLCYCKKRDVKIIAMVGQRESTLYNAADVSLVLPKFSEISDDVKFPSTSATLMSVLGDAIALCLSKAKSVSIDQYRSFHPGGNIGNSLMKVCDVMRTGDDLPIVKYGTKVVEALIVMSQKSVGCVLVEKDNKIEGVITDGDLRRNIKSDFSTCLVQDIMTTHPKSISGDLLAMDALMMMNDKGIMHLVVEEKGALKGLIHMHDCLRIGLKAQCD